MKYRIYFRNYSLSKKNALRKMYKQYFKSEYKSNWMNDCPDLKW